MSEPTILVVHPGASFSTADVFTGMVAGLKANGCRVITYRLDVNLTFFQRVTKTAIEYEIISAPVNPFQLAARGLGDVAIACEPDAVVVVSGGNLHPASIMTLRELAQQRTKQMTTAVYYTESPYFGEHEQQTAHLYDVVFTNERLSVPSFALRNERSFYLPHAYNPDVHQPGPAEADKQSDVFFVGTGFDERKALFEGVRWDDLCFLCLGYGWQGFVSDTLNPQDITDNAEVASYYRSAAICLNHHRTTTTWGSGAHIPEGAAESLGPRAYEIAACGGFQLCDDSRPELRDVFGESVPTYAAGDSADLERKIRHYLKHPTIREHRAADQHEAVRPHTWAARARQMLEILI